MKVTVKATVHGERGNNAKHTELVTRNVYTEEDWRDVNYSWVVWLVLGGLITLLVVGFANVALLQAVFSQVGL
jgi:hypothetical protein